MQLDFAAGGLQDMDIGFGLFGIHAAAFGSSGVTVSDAGLMTPVIGVPDIAGDDGSGGLLYCDGGREEEDEERRHALRTEKRALEARLDATARSVLAVRGENARLHAEAGVLRRRLAEAQRSAVMLIGLSRLLRTANHGGTAPAAVTPQPAGGVASLMT
ncbi:hypothetical protein E2562_024722 [Oryza meyeriana var. granulata]|uniref:BZIP domain-containing protein n=1 Tax=Oryza meyeriana var. granulata TaxID=110450 RepID=A0A6G1D6E4_9ORYZ|nr:hypothetical protein E2562_024722 [Oryza meyeriana var. granulata]